MKYNVYNVYKHNMPIMRNRDSKGYYFQWGNQKKYYYNPNNIKSEKEAYKNAVKQARAIYSHGYKK